MVKVQIDDEHCTETGVGAGSALHEGDPNGSASSNTQTGGLAASCCTPNLHTGPKTVVTHGKSIGLLKDAKIHHFDPAGNFHLPSNMSADVSAMHEHNPRFHGIGCDHCGVKCPMLPAPGGSGVMPAMGGGNNAPIVNALSGPGAKHKTGL